MKTKIRKEPRKGHVNRSLRTLSMMNEERRDEEENGSSILSHAVLGKIGRK